MSLVAELKVLEELSCGRANIPLPGDQLIESYQSLIGMRFTEDYKIFLKAAMNVLYGTKDPLVITDGGGDYGELKFALRDAREAGVPKDWLPFCEDNGDYYCLTPEGDVRFWSHDGLSSERWPDLATWIKNVWIDEN